MSSPGCVPVMVLKNCEPEFSDILTEIFNMSLKESCFADCWKISSVVLVFKNVGDMSTAKNYLGSGVTEAVVLDLSKAFDRVYHAVLLPKPN